MSIVLLVH